MLADGSPPWSREVMGGSCGARLASRTCASMRMRAGARQLIRSCWQLPGGVHVVAAGVAEGGPGWLGGGAPSEQDPRQDMLEAGIYFRSSVWLLQCGCWQAEWVELAACGLQLSPWPPFFEQQEQESERAGTSKAQGHETFRVSEPRGRSPALHPPPHSRFLHACYVETAVVLRLLQLSRASATQCCFEVKGLLMFGMG